MQKVNTPNWSEKLSGVKRDKNTIPWTYLIEDLNSEEIVEMFYEEELQKTNQTELRVEKVIKKKGDKLYVKSKGYDNSFNSWIDKKDILYKMSYFPQPYTHSKNKIKAELDFSNYATKSDLKNATGVNRSKFAKKDDLVNLNQILINQILIY